MELEWISRDLKIFNTFLNVAFLQICFIGIKNFFFWHTIILVSNSNGQ